MDNLFELIRKSHGQAAADTFRTFSRSQRHLDAIKEGGRDVLMLFPPKAGSCAMMSAVFSVRVRALLDAPYHVVAGTLHIEGTPVFGMEAEKADWSASFSGTNLSWDGHCWLVCGDLIADVSLLRTANSPKSPPALATKARSSFGTSTGMVAFTAAQARGIGIDYKAYHVLTQEEIDALFAGSQALIPAR